MNTPATSPKVFFPHPIISKSKIDGTVGYKFPLEPVMQFGIVTNLLTNSELAGNAPLCRSVLKEQFRVHGFTPERDYFIIAGDPTVLIYMAEVAIAEYGRTPRLLRWRRKTNSYQVCGTEDSLYGEEEG